jgi:hypothetical protein
MREIRLKLDDPEYRSFLVLPGSNDHERLLWALATAYRVRTNMEALAQRDEQKAQRKNRLVWTPGDEN